MNYIRMPFKLSCRGGARHGLASRQKAKTKFRILSKKKKKKEGTGRG